MYRLRRVGCGSAVVVVASRCTLGAASDSADKVTRWWVRKDKEGGLKHDEKCQHRSYSEMKADRPFIHPDTSLEDVHGLLTYQGAVDDARVGGTRIIGPEGRVHGR